MFDADRKMVLLAWFEGGFTPSSPLPPKPAEQPTMHITLGEGGALLSVQVGAVVLVGGLGTGEGARPGELPDAGRHLPDEAHLDGGQQ